MTSKLPRVYGSSTGGTTYADDIVTTPLGVPQLAVPLVEKLYVRANQLYGWHSNDPGYAGIENGWPHLAMQMLTGQPAHRHNITHQMSDAALWGNVSLVNKGKLVALTTPLFLNIPGEFVVPGIISQHAYSVLEAHDGGTLANHTVRVLNPWGMTEPDGEGGYNPGGDGQFTLSLKDLRTAYRPWRWAARRRATKPDLDPTARQRIRTPPTSVAFLFNSSPGDYQVVPLSRLCE